MHASRSARIKGREGRRLTSYNLGSGNFATEQIKRAQHVQLGDHDESARHGWWGGGTKQRK